MENIVTSGDLSSAVVDFSLLSLFLKADLVVKSVIIILIAASIYSWAVIVEKLVKMRKVHKPKLFLESSLRFRCPENECLE